MTDQTALIGHEAAWHEWRAAMASARMHHGWILAGPPGTGKGTFARAAAAELVAEAGSAQSQPRPGMHPDVIVLEHLPATSEDQKKKEDGKPYQLKRNITIDQIRQVQSRLNTRPTLGSRRVVIVDPVDDLEKGAANALLKSLEEPPAGTFFLLVAHRPGQLPATVRSRCRLLRFPPVGTDELSAWTARNAPGVDGETLAAAVAAADGSPGTALRFVEQKLGPVHALMRRILAEGDPAFILRGALAEELGARPDRARMLAVLDLARTALARDLADMPRTRQLAAIEAHGALVRLARQAPTWNFDPGLLVMEIGGLLASAAMPRETA
jgi:DNA polymerase-3 subunit delta'